MKKKSGTSRCPLDQISVIPFKKCPKTFLWRISSSAWTRAEFPTLRHNQPWKGSTNQKWWQLYLFSKGLQFPHELRSLERKFNENHLWLYQHNRYYQFISYTKSRYAKNTFTRKSNGIYLFMTFSETWLKKNIDSHLNWLYRKCLHFPSVRTSHIFKSPRTNSVWTSQVQKNFTMNVNYQFRETLKRHQISKPGNFTKPQAVNMLIQTQS